MPEAMRLPFLDALLSLEGSTREAQSRASLGVLTFPKYHDGTFWEIEARSHSSRAHPYHQKYCMIYQEPMALVHRSHYEYWSCFDLQSSLLCTQRFATDEWCDERIVLHWFVAKESAFDCSGYLVHGIGAYYIINNLAEFLCSMTIHLVLRAKIRHHKFPSIVWIQRMSKYALQAIPQEDWYLLLHDWLYCMLAHNRDEFIGDFW